MREPLPPVAVMRLFIAGFNLGAIVDSLGPHLHPHALPRPWSWRIAYAAGLRLGFWWSHVTGR